MCALAQILKKKGYIITGSDIDDQQVKFLNDKGIKTFLGHKKSNIKKDIDVVVVSSSISSDNPEVLKAQSLKIKIINRGELLGLFSKSYKNVIAVSGSHGKTTTTSMIFEIFKVANLEPTVHVGGIIRSINSNFFLGKDDFFITEACEFKDNFLYLKPTVSVITNIEPEHMEYFKTKKHLYKSFKTFANNSNFVVCKNKIAHKNKIHIGKMGYNSRDLVLCEDGCYKFKIFNKNKFLFEIKLNIVGQYNVENAVMACAVAKHYKIKNKDIKTALENFDGVQRRFDIISSNPKIIHDYAHHPSELKAVINATKFWTLGKLIVVFQPHTYTRTKTLMDEFMNCFNCCDLLVIIKTYSAREKEVIGGRAIDLYENLKNTGKFNGKILYFDDFDSTENFLNNFIKSKDNVLFLGAGNIERLAQRWKST